VREGSRRFNPQRTGIVRLESFSIVIINDDAEEYLAGLFESIDKQEAPVQTEIIVIDNASRDASLDVERLYEINKIHRFKKKEPAPRLYNKGIELSDTPAVLFMHSDILLCDGFFDSVLDFLRNRGRGPSIINFNQFYVDHNWFGNNYIGCSISDGAFFYRKYFDWNCTDAIDLVQCSEGCFMLFFNSMNAKPFFDERYHGSMFEYAYTIENNLTVACIDGAYYHYFIEAHEKLMAYEEDRALFIERIWPHLDILRRKKIRGAKIKIAIRALANIVLPQGSLIRKIIVKIITNFRIKL